MALKAAATIAEQGAKVGELVDKLLRYTTLESPDAAPHLEPVGLDDAVQDALKALREKLAARQARVDYRGAGITLQADKTMLVESLKNLVENAVKFDPKPSPIVALRVEDSGGWTAISVTDMGPGIPSEQQKAVFSRFHQIDKDFTGQKDGMGLGLAYVKKVAELHGGSVALTSRLGQGTTVTLTLPAKKRA
jgi:signal transduction histidine kinase